MKFVRFTALLVATVLFAGVAFAQGVPTSTLTGRVISEGQGLPGVTVVAKSPALQGTRTAVTSINGDFVLPQLPPGDYTATFTMSGFQTVTRQLKLSAAQTTPVQVTMGVAAIAAEAVVVAQSETISQTQQNATTLTSDTLGKLPTARNIASAVNLAPGATGTGPSGNTVIGGAMSFENLFLVNGVAVQDNIRNTPYNLFIEDAIQEQTVAVSGISAEYGRFTGGVVNVITKSGGNTFSGSFRTSLNNDKWTTKTAYINPATGTNPEVKIDEINPTYEATIGGPIIKDTLWFFGAGRYTDTSFSGNLAAPILTAFPRGTEEKRYEGKLTFSFAGRHTLLGNYQQIDNEQSGYFFGTVYDMNSVYTRQLPQEMISGNYSGTLSDSFFLEAQYSSRKFTFQNSGARATDLIFGTMMVNNANGYRWWSPTFCAVCGPEKRDAVQGLLKGTYFLSTPKLGSHQIRVGGELYDDKRLVNNHQSGSGYRIYTTNIVAQGGVVYPAINSAATGTSPTYILWNPILENSQGTSFKTWSFFVNDTWNLNRNLTFNVGLRWDKNDGTDASGRKTTDDSKFSPRLGVTWDPRGDGDLQVNASYARYVAAIANNQADAAALGGQPASVSFDYRGPTINWNLPAGAPLVGTEQAIRQVFEWFFANGGTGRPTRGAPSIPGLNPNIEESLASPNTDEFALGITKRIGSKGVVRADFVYRDWTDFYATRVDTGTGTVSGTLAGTTRTFDKQLIVNQSIDERYYTAMTLSSSYRLFESLQLQGNWTWARLRGTFDGETAANGPIRSGQLSYPEYFNASWSATKGDLGADQRHKVRLWAIWDLPLNANWFKSSFSVLQNYDTGTPYGAAGGVDTRPYVTNPGYLTPPATVTYYFTARDAFRTEDVWRTDISLNIAFRPIGSLELFVEPQLLNAFNSQAVTGPNASIETRASVGTAAYAAFNPFTEKPTAGPRASGANWNYGPLFGQPTGPASYQLARTFRMSLGLRF